MDIKNVNYLQDNMCRTCMKKCNQIQNKNKGNCKVHSIYEVSPRCQSNASFMEILQILEPSIKVTTEDNLPKILCAKCKERLLNAYEFIETYKKVDKKFREMLKEFNSISNNDSLEFREKKDHAFEILNNLDDDVDSPEIKVEFEIEDACDITQEALVENEIDIDLPELEDERLSDISQSSKEKTPSADESGSNGNNDKKCSYYKRCQRTRSQRNIDKKILEKNIKDDKIGLPPQNEDGSVVCHECDEVLENVKIWQQHMRQHRLGEIPKKKYKRRTTHKQAKTLSKFECEYCGKAFQRTAAYKNHIRVHTGEEPYLCIECGKSFKVVGSLNTHMLRHKGEKTYQCPHCPKKFVCSSGLYGHLYVHSNEKPYVCDICGSAFHMAYQLRNHNLYHTGTKKYQCEYCDMRFITSEKQRRHMRTHTGEKPYRCKYCERAFAQSNDMIKHLRQHLGDNVYQCELCPLRFPMARDVKTHFATHKDDDEETRARNLQARLEEERNLRIKLGVQES